MAELLPSVVRGLENVCSIQPPFSESLVWGPPGGEPIPGLEGILACRLALCLDDSDPEKGWPWGTIHLGAFLPAAGSHAPSLGPGKLL